MSELLKQIKPDIVQGVGMPLYRMTLGYKNAIHFSTLRNYCYEDYPDHYGKMIGNVMAFLDICLIRKRLRKNEQFVVCSESLSKMYMERQGIKLPFIRNGVDVSKYTKRNMEEIGSLREKLNLPKDKAIFVYSGGFIDRKNQKEAIEGFLKINKCKEAALLLLGDGTDLDGLMKLYSEHDNVLFRGKVDNMNEYLHACDVYVATSKSEGLPNGVLEAMATGLPVVLSDIPQHMEVLEADDRSGYSYHLGNVEDLTSAMERIMEENLTEKGEHSYNAVMSNFTAEGMSRKYQEVYKELIR